MTDYTRFPTERRLSRRLALRLGGLAGVAAGAGTLACGGSQTKSTPTTIAGRAATAAGGGPAASTPTTPAARQPKPGGSVAFQLPSAPPSLDPFTQSSFLTAGINSLVYSKLFRFRTGVPDVSPGDISVEPDLAQAQPEQPDDLHWVVKLKPAQFSDGRPLTSEDVRAAIDRYQHFEKSVHRTTWDFLDIVETPDAQTVVLKTKFPYADLVAIAGGNLGAYIVPKDLAESPDIATRMLGSGPFVLKEYVTGNSFTFARSSNYFDTPFPYFDELKIFITTDQSKRLADFSSKAVDLSYYFLADERDQLKKNRPDARAEQLQSVAFTIFMRTDMPPFNDKRIRQALSMALNRAAIRESLSKGEGVDDQGLWTGLSGWALQVRELGAAAKYWKYDPQAAKQLLQAAGADKIDTTWSHADASVYQQSYVDTATLAQAQWRDIGVTAKDNLQPYAQYISSTFRGEYQGVGHRSPPIPYWIDFITEQFSWNSSLERGRINLSYVNDPRVNQLLEKQRSQFKIDERKATLKDIQLLIAEEQWQIYLSTEPRSYFWSPDIQSYRPSAFYPFTHFMKAWRGQ